MSGKEEKTNGPEILPRRPKCWQRRKEAGKEEGGRKGRGGRTEGRTEGEQNQSLLCDRPERVRVRHYQSLSRGIGMKRFFNSGSVNHGSDGSDQNIYMQCKKSDTCSISQLIKGVKKGSGISDPSKFDRYSTEPSYRL